MWKPQNMGQPNQKFTWKEIFQSNEVKFALGVRGQCATPFFLLTEPQLVGGSACAPVLRDESRLVTAMPCSLPDTQECKPPLATRSTKIRFWLMIPRQVDGGGGVSGSLTLAAERRVTDGKAVQHFCCPTTPVHHQICVFGCSSQLAPHRVPRGQKASVLMMARQKETLDWRTPSSAGLTTRRTLQPAP